MNILQKIKFISLVSLLIIAQMACAQESPSVKIWAAKLDKGEAAPLFEVKNDTEGKKAGWKNRIYIQPNVTFQTIEGIGGAFNEIGGEALLSLSKKEQDVVMNNLFSKDKAGFTFCRTAIGASDFGINAYSYSMTADDFEMEHFSVDRDQKYVLPYIKSAFAINPNFTLFASPWSPPAWMKESGKMVGLQKEGNRMKSDPKVQKAYAKYFVKYVQEYAKAGVKIDRICIQNENDADTKYPSCIFPAKEMVAFANKYMAPAFKKNKIETKIYAGTFRAANQMDLMDFVQCKNMDGIDGIGIQYTETKIINDARTLVPNMKIIHTEGDCYNGKNSAEEAGNRLKEVASYINSGSTNFTYWNMILNETTKSGWEWPQNSLINIDRKNGTVQYNPDYNAMYIISKFIQPGDVRIASVNRSNSHPIITVKSPDGTIKVLLQNTNEKDGVFELVIGEKSIKVHAPAQAITAVELKK
ncbi:glycoside hydrolase family 30 protein [Marinifilum sp. RC60d5]|uniref:glycoside hydrolase family 30 protein n=1 Tax=Marinifilum sp. RC60d5 TaxID=3458414 RepID=UPI0040350974